MDTQQPARFGDVLRVSEFAVLLAAQVTSGLGDQLARVALALSVLHRSGSLLLTSSVYAVSYVPWLLGGPFLISFATRFRSRQVLIACDVVRVVTVLAMTVTGLPIAALLGLILLTELAAPPFGATRSALLPEMLEGDRYVVGSALVTTVEQLIQVGGLAVAGVVVTSLGTQSALVIDSLTFAASVVLLSLGVQDRPPVPRESPASLLTDTRDGLVAVFGNPRIRQLVVLAWSGMALSVAPEALTVGLAAQLHSSRLGLVGLLIALPLGMAVGSLAVAKVRPDRRPSLVAPLVLLSGAPLLLAPLFSTTVGVVALVFCGGLGGAFFPLIASTVGRAADPVLRSRIFGVAASGLMACQGLAMLGSGALASWLDPVHALPVASLIGLAVVLPLLAARRRTPSAVPDLREVAVV